MEYNRQTIKNEIDSNIIRISVEGFKVSKTKEGVKISGISLPYSKTSRNGFTYVTESIKDCHKSMQSKPVLFNHNPDIVIGHNIGSKMETEGLGYDVDINPNAINVMTGVPFAESIERGDLNKVSIQCMYDDEKSFVDEEGITHAYINEFLEMSFVSIPGFEDTTAYLSESLKLKNKQVGEKMPEEKAKARKEQKEEEEEKPKEEPKEEKASKEQEEEPEEEPDKKKEPDAAEVMETRLSAMEDRLAALEKSKEQVDEEPEKDKEGEAEEKVEEALKDKTVVASESNDTPKEVTTTDLKNIFKQRGK